MSGFVKEYFQPQSSSTLSIELLSQEIKEKQNTKIKKMKILKTEKLIFFISQSKNIVRKS